MVVDHVDGAIREQVLKIDEICESLAIWSETITITAWNPAIPHQTANAPETFPEGYSQVNN